MSGKAVVTNSGGFHIIDIDQLKTTYAEACVEAINRLAKVQADTAKKMGDLLANMAKLAGN